MIRKLFQVGNIEDYNPDYDEEQAFYFETSRGAHEECKAQRQSGIDENARITVGFFITPDELTQIKKEAFEAGAVRAQWEIIIGNYTYEVSEIKPPDLYEYLKRHFETEEK